MAAKHLSRTPRGRYAPLICLNCRSRKIKCHLPSLETQPSEFPQPPEAACERCQYLGLDCVVQKTVLGRPAARRNRSRVTTSASSVTAESFQTVDVDESSSAEGLGIEDYLLSEVPDTISPVSQTQQRIPKNSHEAFEALVSPPYLLSSLLSHDRRFAASIPPALNSIPVPVAKFVSAGLAALLDESLVWLRFYQPNVPHLTELRQKIVSSPPGTLTKVEDSSDNLLFALLCLIALDVPSSRLRQDRQLYRNLQTVVCHQGQAFIFNSPTSYQSLLILILLSKYRPTALVISQHQAAVTLKSELYVSLANQTAERLAAKCSGTALAKIFEGGMTEPEAENAMLEGLQWCSSVVYCVFHGGLNPNQSSTTRRLASQIGGITMILPNVLRRYPQKPSVVYQFHRIKIADIDMQHMAQTKIHWREMDKLSEIIELHKEQCSQHRNQMLELLRLSRTSHTSNEEIALATSLLETDIQQSLTHVAGMSLFYTMMHALKSTTSPTHDPNEDIQPSEATQISEQVIRTLKSIRIGRPADITAFLTQHGDERIARMERILSTFASSSRDLQLEGVGYLPPPGTTVLQILSQCRELVENNAARMKGWGGLHPEVEQHLALFESCARALEGMSVPVSSPAETSALLAQSFGRGCLYAASAKLIRGLYKIVDGWKSRVAAEEASNMSWTFAEADGQSNSTDSAPSYDSSILDMDFDELFGQWSSWPHADMMDFSQFSLD